MPPETVDVEARTRVAVVESAVEKIEKSVARIADSIGQVVRLEEKHAETRESVGRAFKAIEKLEANQAAFVSEMRDRLGKTEAALESTKTALEPLKETRGWIISGVLGVVTLVAVAVLSMVVVRQPAHVSSASAATTAGKP